MYLMQVKSPAESKQPWDYSRCRKLPGEQVFTTKAESKCASGSKPPCDLRGRSARPPCRQAHGRSRCPPLLSQLLLGLVNGSFYAVLSLGLAVIFGLLHVINFAHGALFMLGACWPGSGWMRSG
jgi:hypothetical protein